MAVYRQWEGFHKQMTQILSKQQILSTIQFVFVIDFLYILELSIITIRIYSHSNQYASKRLVLFPLHSHVTIAVARFSPAGGNDFFPNNQLLSTRHDLYLCLCLYLYLSTSHELYLYLHLYLTVINFSPCMICLGIYSETNQ